MDAWLHSWKKRGKLPSCPLSLYTALLYFSLSRTLEGLWRENRGSVNRLENYEQILRTWIYESCYYSLCLEILRFDSLVWTAPKYWTVPWEQIFQPVENSTGTVRKQPQLLLSPENEKKKNNFILQTCRNVTGMSLLEMQIFFSFNLSWLVYIRTRKILKE